VCRKIFEPFYRGESRSKNGSGLGLYVVKCLATAMGYEVEAKVAEDVFEVKMRM
jgi:signal transduction histidine kinase